MGIAQESFDAAVKHYDKAILYLEEIGEKIQSYVKKYSIDIAKCQFDRLLQIILLKTAIGDNSLESIELTFIEKITDSGDLLIWINRQYNTSFSWDALDHITEVKLTELLNRLEDDFRKNSLDFLYPFAAADYITSFDYYAALRKCIVGICSAFTYVDGDGEDKDEDETMFAAINDYFDLPYKVCVDDVCNNQSNDNDRKGNKNIVADTTNSLEANFEKLKKK